MKLLPILALCLIFCATSVSPLQRVVRDVKANPIIPAAVSPSATFVGKVGATTKAPACSTLPSGAFLLVDNWAAVTRQILTILPEGVKCPSTYLSSGSSQWDPNFRFQNLANLGGETTASITLTFLYVNAGYKNQLGYFTFDNNGKIINQTVLYQCIQMGTTAPGCLTIGDSVKIGPFTSTDNVGFFIRANGYGQTNVPLYYSLTSLNTDGKDHIAMFQDSVTGRVIFGFEDQSLGDADYNDVIFTATSDPALASLPSVPVTITCNTAGCSNKGTCDTTTGRCNCNAGSASSFSGALCTTTVTCSTPCVNGLCVADDLCQCNSGFAGDLCDLAVLVDTAAGLSSTCGKRTSNLYYLGNELTGSVSITSDLDNLYVNIGAATGFTVANIRIQAGTGTVPTTLAGLLDTSKFNVINSLATAKATANVTIGLTSIGATCGSTLNLAVNVDIKTKAGLTLTSWLYGENIISTSSQFWFSYQVCCDGLAPKPQPVIPIVNCVSANEDGTWTARFSYNNQNLNPVNIAIGASTNALTPGNVNQGQPFVFLAGLVADAFYVILDDCGSSVTWSLTGPDAVTRSVTANRNSTMCTAPPASPPPTFQPPTLPITPILWCTSPNDDGTYTSRWGYNSLNTQTVLLPIDTTHNFFTGNVDKKSQTVLFLPGTKVNDFYLTWDGTPITWSIVGPDLVTRTATADTVTKLCGQDIIINDTTLVTTLPKPPCSPISISGCGVLNEDKTITARFSYVSTNTFVAGIAVGANNQITTGDGSKPRIVGQPVLFAPGTATNAFFAVINSKTSVTWSVLTPYATAAATVTVSADTPACPDNTPAPAALTGSITPIVNCVLQNDDGTFTARFGYTTDVNAELFAVKSNSDNYVTPSGAPQSQTLYFRKGTHNNTFFIVYKSLPITWSVRGPDGQLNSVTADSSADNCAPTTKYTGDITPTLNCIVLNDDKSYTARFGYNNANTNGLVKIPQGSSNVMSFGDGRQPTVFGPGVHNLVFYVVYNATNLPATWTLTSPNGKTTTLSVTVNGPNSCASLT